MNNREAENLQRAIEVHFTPEELQALREQLNKPESITLTQSAFHFRQHIQMLMDGEIDPLTESLTNIITQTPFNIDGSGLFQSVVHYGMYVDMHNKSREDMQRFLDDLQTTVAASVDAVKENDFTADPAVYLLHALSKRVNSGQAKNLIPRMCLVSGHLFGEGGNLPTLIEGWYQDAIENLGIAQQHLDEYISLLRSRIKNNETQVDSFLQNLQYDITSLNAGCLNLATICALHVQKEDCAVYTGTSPYNVKKHERQHVRNSMNELLSFPVYAQYNSELRSSSGMEDGIVNVPTYVSVIDIEEFIKLWKAFWEHALASLQPGTSKRFLDHFVRPIATDREARIAWNFHPNNQQELNIRIDHEKNAPNHSVNHIAIDIGKVELQDALSYALEVGEKSTKQEVVMGYSSLLDNRGSHSYILDPSNPLPRHKEFYYPSVMKSRSLTDINQKVALVASVILRQGKELGLFSGCTFGYHYRNGALDCDENRKNFEAIARRFQTLVPRN